MSGIDMAIIGSTSSHGGHMVTATGATFQTTGGSACVDGDMHSCPIYGHGTTPVAANSTTAICGSKKVVLNGSVAGCGAIIDGNFAPSWILT